MIEDIQFDSIALAEFMLMGYILGERTLVKNINQVEPVSLLSITNGIVKKQDYIILILMLRNMKRKVSIIILKTYWNYLVNLL